MRNAKTALVVGALALVLAAAAALGTASPSGAIIHEMIGASCRVDGFNNPPEPRGQSGASNGNSFVQALQATGVISSIVGTPTNVTINFDLSKPNAKFDRAHARPGRVNGVGVAAMSGGEHGPAPSSLRSSAADLGSPHPGRRSCGS
jgi:hypothetical protein